MPQAVRGPGVVVLNQVASNRGLVRIRVDDDTELSNADCASVSLVRMKLNRTRHDFCAAKNGIFSGGSWVSDSGPSGPHDGP